MVHIVSQLNVTDIYIYMYYIKYKKNINKQSTKPDTWLLKVSNKIQNFKFRIVYSIYVVYKVNTADAIKCYISRSLKICLRNKNVNALFFIRVDAMLCGL